MATGPRQHTLDSGRYSEVRLRHGLRYTYTQRQICCSARATLWECWRLYARIRSRTELRIEFSRAVASAGAASGP